LEKVRRIPARYKSADQTDNPYLLALMLGLLVERTYLRPSTVIALDVITEEGVRTGDEWAGIPARPENRIRAYQGEARSRHLPPSGRVELDLLVLGSVHACQDGNQQLRLSFLLKYFNFIMQSATSSMEIKGAVIGNKLVLDILTAGQARKERITLKEPPYLAPNIKPALILLGLEPGRKYRFPLFNPATMSTEDASISVEAKEHIKVGDSEQTVYKLKETFQGLEAFPGSRKTGTRSGKKVPSATCS
jgi:hypothetical protein